MRLYLGHARSFGVPKLRALALAGWIAASSLPAAAAELARPNGIEEGFTLWSSSAEYRAFWKADPPRNPWLMADAVASTYDVGTRALRSGDDERAYSLWLSLAQAGNCRAKFAVGYLLDPASPAALDSITSGGRPVSAEERATTAFAWYLSAAEEGWPAAQRHVADAYAAGIVVPADLTAAKLWYRRAARAMDPDAMLALASLLLPSHISAERIEGLAWALIARDNENVFWFNDAKLETVIAAYRDALVAEDVEKAAAIARDWWRLEWLIHGGGDDEVSRHRAAFKRMLVDLPKAEVSPAATFDAAALAALEGRHQDAFDLWWPLARRGYCQAQLAVGILEGDSSSGEVQPNSYPENEPIASYDVFDTVMYHAGMQGLAYAQIEAWSIGYTPEFPIEAVLEGSLRWIERAAMQGHVYMIRHLVQQRFPDTGVDNESLQVCLHIAFIYQRTGRHDQNYIADHCQSMLSPAEAMIIEQEAQAWQPEAP